MTSRVRDTNDVSLYLDSRTHRKAPMNTTLAQAHSVDMSCSHGQHTITLRDREDVARRLLAVSRKHSFDPDIDVEWGGVQDPDRFYISPEMVSLYETPLWNELDHRGRVELSKQEFCSITSLGITAELMLMASLIRHASDIRYGSGSWAYALTEIEDECRHSKMFARMITEFGVDIVAPRWGIRQAGRMAGAISDPVGLFAGALLVEEFTDALQRVTFPDEALQPTVRSVTRIHVIEETRHIKFAREELKHQLAQRSSTSRHAAGYAVAHAARYIRGTVIDPSCYAAVGLDPRQARLAARNSTHRREVEQWMLRKCMAFFDEVGFLDGPARAVWIKSGLLHDGR